MNIRRLACFSHQEEEYLGIMFYDNYVVLYQLASNRYCKLTGHRSYVGNLTYNAKGGMVVTGGMDHRISLVELAKIS
jgi:WD40 repeat protein